VKDFSILVIETSVAFGNGYLIPAGPLREPISNALEKSDLLITIGERSDQKNFARDFSYLKLPPSSDARLKPRKNSPSLKNKLVIGFSGIAHPEKFLTTLKHLGASIIRFEIFPNHKPFKIKALKILINQAKKHKAILITTEKDFVKIPKDLKNNFHALTVNLELGDQKLVLEKLVKVL
jgi:tetraacyldisaccharide 4'-kinase